MSAVKAILTLLLADDAIGALVDGDNIMAGNLPLDTALPAISITHISSVPLAAIDAQATHSLVTSRVQVTGLADEYQSCKELMAAIRRACNYQRGDIAGVLVASILRDADGPDFANEDASIHEQSTDFKVTFHEPH